MSSDSRATSTDVASRVATDLDGELVLVSNREPYEHEYGDDGEITVSKPAGGLTAGLDPVMQRLDGTWIAWGSGAADRTVADEDGRIRVPPGDETYTLQRVWLDEETVEGFYYGYANRVLWPLCHGGVWKTEYAERHWQRYRQVNETFAEQILEHADQDALVWFQDYHFALAPRLVREARPDGFLAHFWHINWPGWDTFRACPQATDLLEGLLANDLLGFHVQPYCETFLDCVENAIEDATIDRERGTVEYDGQVTTVRAFPLGIDAEAIREASLGVDPAVWHDFRAEHDLSPDVRVALGVDRLDYTKGIPERLDALERLFVSQPAWRGNLTYVQKANESRSLIPDYKDLQERVERRVDEINERFATDDWQPVIYLDEYYSQEKLCGLYRNADAMIVSALRDGMNLTAKEYVAAQVDCDCGAGLSAPSATGTDGPEEDRPGRPTDCGVLLLSDQTGAHEQLGDDAVTINPYDTEAFAEAIDGALTMPARERRARMCRLRATVESEDLYAWLDDVFEATTALRRARRIESKTG